MSVRFDKVFPKAALAFSIAALLIATAPVLVAFSISGDNVNSAGTDLSILSQLILDHFRIFALCVWLYFAAAALAALGLLRRRRWAFRAWIVLLGMSLAWGVGVALSEIIHLFGAGHSSSPSPGYMPQDSIMTGVVVVPTCFVMALCLVWLLRKLLSHRETLTGVRRV